MLQRYSCVPLFLRILVVVAFWGLGSVGVSASPAPEEAADLRLGDDVVPVFQSIHLTVDADQGVLIFCGHGFLPGVALDRSSPGMASR